MKNLIISFSLSLMALLGGFSLMAQTQYPDDDAQYATELLKPGTEAPDFTLKTNEGKNFQLNSLKGRYIVLDFWASWCPDCRREIPNVKRMYEDFSPKGVEFVGISFDDKEEKWKNAIEEYDLDYIHVSELKRMRDSEIAKTYGIKWIPSMYLIGPDGKIMVSTVLSYKIEKALTEAFPAPAPKGTSQNVTIQGSMGKLAAIIQKPELEDGERCPLAVICHGFTGNKNENLLMLIADSLQANGVGSIRFDFNGHGESEGAFEDMTVPNEVEDAKNVVRYALSLPWVDEIYMAGHSQGGVVASMTAGEMGDTIKRVVLLAPAAVLRDDAIRGNTMGAMYNPLNPPESVELRGSLKLGRNYIRTAFSLPIYETAARYHGQALIIHGTGDRVVPYTYGERYHEIWPSSRLEILDAFDHGFTQNVYRAARLASDFLLGR